MKRLFLFYTLIFTIIIIGCNKTKQNNLKSEENDLEQNISTLSPTNNDADEKQTGYLNAPFGYLALHVYPDENSESHTIYSGAHKREVVITNEFEGWKEIDGRGWIKKEYLVNTLDELFINVNLIKQYCGEYKFEKMELIKPDDIVKDIEDVPYNKQDYEIVVEYIEGDTFILTEITAEVHGKRHHNNYKMNVPTCTVDSINNGELLIYDGELLGAKRSHRNQFYFIPNGIIERKIFGRNNSENLIYDIVYIKE